MQPNKNLITISDNPHLIVELLQDLVLAPRLKALAWSKVTKQTPNMKIGYPGQHLVSLALGMEGARTGARGHDIVDGSEVKSCSRVDQVDSCMECGEKVLRIEKSCPVCESTQIKRMNDSKWLFTIRSENDLKVLLNDVDRVVLAIADYPNFSKGDFEDLRFQLFEIWTKSPRCINFKKLMENYYYKVYLKHKSNDAEKTPAPCNFWTFMFQFYMCNPIKILDCLVKGANTKNPKTSITHYIEPELDRATIDSELMPTTILTPQEIRSYIETLLDSELTHLISEEKTIEDLRILFKLKRFNSSKLAEILPFIDEKIRQKIPLRELNEIKVQEKYRRK
ncbi:MAG: hypothetical protein RI894_553 [Bacteroidota bacterium]